MNRRLFPLFVGACLLTAACGGDDQNTGTGGTGGTGGATGGAGGTGGSGGTGGMTSSGGSGGGPVSAPVVELATGFESACALMSDHQVKCWGDNKQGQLGLGDALSRGDQAGEMGPALPALDLGTGEEPVPIAGTNEHGCVVLLSGLVKCWGRNGNGQLGQGDALARGDQAGEMGDALTAVDLGPSPGAQQIATGYTHTCVQLEDETLRCWGNNGACQLGQGTIGGNVGDAAGEMGSALLPSDLGAGVQVHQITAGHSHSCSVLQGGVVKCWGSNTSGQLGLGDGMSRGCSAATSGDNLAAVDAGGVVESVFAGGNHTCALLVDHSVKCWGANERGQLGQGSKEKLGDGPGEMGVDLAAIDLGAGVTAIQVSVGNAHTCALLEGGGVKCWGQNQTGQLGLGDAEDRGDEPGEMGDALPAVDLGIGRSALLVRAGHTHTCAILDDRTVKCWGSGASGALGQGTVEVLGDEPGEMGDALPTVKLF